MTTKISEDVLVQAVKLLPEEVYPEAFKYLSTLAAELESKMPTIEEIKEKFKPVFEKHPVSRAYLFGSYARGENTIKSDIDIQVLPLEGMEYLNFKEEFRLDKDLNSISDIKVSLVQDDLKERFKKRVLDERILIYER